MVLLAAAASSVCSVLSVEGTFSFPYSVHFSTYVSLTMIMTRLNVHLRVV